jgi:hypothetical protein
VRYKQIALMLGLSSTTMLRKHFRKELAIGPAEAKANVLNRLFRMASSGRDPAATTFWLKTRGRWSEKGNPPEPTTRSGPIKWVIRVNQPPAPPGFPEECEETARRLRAVSGAAHPEWEGDKGDPQEDQW